MKKKAMELRMKMQAEEMFQMVESGSTPSSAGVDGLQHPVQGSSNAPFSTADGENETDDVVMDGVEAVLSNDLQAAVDNFMNSLKQNRKILSVPTT